MYLSKEAKNIFKRVDKIGSKINVIEVFLIENYLKRIK